MNLRNELHAMADEVPVGPPPLAEMLAARPRRRPPRWVPPLAVAAAVLAVIGGVEVLDFGGRGHQKPGDDRTTHAPATSQQSWEKLPAPPLSPRWQQISAYVDGKVVVLGGTSSTISGGPFSGRTLRDGAVFDPEHRTWKAMAEAPAALINSAYTYAVAGDRLIIPVQHHAWLSYDVGDDEWSRLPAPPGPNEEPVLTADADHVYALAILGTPSLEPVQVLDLDTGRWSALPAIPDLARLDLPGLVMTDVGLVLVANPRRSAAHQWGEPRAVAEIWDGRRWTRSDAPGLGGRDWHWTGRRIVSGFVKTEREAHARKATSLPAGAFDPATATWEALPWLPRRWTETAGSDITSFGPRTFGWGYLYDDETGDYTRIESPSSFAHGAAVLTDRALVVIGGERPEPGQEPGARVTRLELTNEAWILPLD